MRQRSYVESGILESQLMGLETTCLVSIGKQSCDSKVLLETTEIVIRGELRRKILFTDIKELTFDDKGLTLVLAEGPVVLNIGSAAEKWAKKILAPPRRIDKLGVKFGFEVAILGKQEQLLKKEIIEIGGIIASTNRRDLDQVYLILESKSALKMVAEAKAKMKPGGAVWIVYPKGVTQITESDVLQAGRAAELKDVKVISFSETQTALKFVIPVALR